MTYNICMAEKKKKPAKKKTTKKSVKASAKAGKKAAKKTSKKTIKASPKASKKTASNGAKPKTPAKPRMTKTKRAELEWMMWRIDKIQRDDPPYLNLVRAIAYYNHKYGKVPNRCEASSEWGKGMATPDGLTLTRSNSIQPHHLMLTVDTSLEGLPIKRPTR